MNSDTNINPRVIMVIARQLNQLTQKSPEGVKVITNDQDILDIHADIIGPEDTPYYGGIFRVQLVLPPDFPKCPPKGYCITKIFHPNISEKGEICVNTLKQDWNPAAWSLYNIFEVIKCLLIEPFPESALNEEAGKLFMENYDEYFKHAKLLTEVYAMNSEEKKQKQQEQIEKPQQNSMNIIPATPPQFMPNIGSSKMVPEPSNFVVPNSQISPFQIQKTQNDMSLVKENFNEFQPQVYQNQSNIPMNMTNNNFTLSPCRSAEKILKPDGSQQFTPPKNSIQIDNLLLQNNQSQSNMMIEEPLSSLTHSFSNNSSKKPNVMIPINLTFSNNNNFHQPTVNNNSAQKENDKKQWLKRI